jgi:Mrp family chromosome partitioning ATPase
VCKLWGFRCLKKEEGSFYVSLIAFTKLTTRKEELGLQELGTDALMQNCILVMCGLPGAGKTTMTSLLARQCEGAIACHHD